MWSGPIWAIESSGWRSLLTTARAARFDVSAGPAADAESYGLPIRVKDGVGIIRLNGPMMKRVSPIMRDCGMTGTDDLTAAVRAAAVDRDVETILFKVDSPGGSVDGLAELGDAVRSAAQIKPVIAQVDGMAASAAYYAVAHATEIRAGRMDMVGSIGTIMVVYDESKAFESEGVEAVVVSTGPLKATGTPGAPVTSEQRAYLQALVDAYFADFKSQVATGRKMSSEQVQAVSSGAVWTTGDAMRLGLVDKVATFRETYGELLAGRASRRARISARVQAMKISAQQANPTA